MSDVDAMVDHFEGVVAVLTDRHFPLIRTRKRSNEHPWITHRIRRLWKKKKRIYKKKGKSGLWHRTDHQLTERIRESKEAFVEK